MDRYVLPIACHLWCYRQLLGKDGLVQKMDSVLAQIAEAGFQGVQSFTDMIAKESDAETFAQLLAKHHLHTAGIYAGGPLYDPATAEPYVEMLVKAIHQARGFLDIRSLTISPDPLPEDNKKTEEHLTTQANALKTLSQRLSEHSVRLLYHFNVHDLVNSGHDFKQMMRHVPNRSLGVCFDVDNARQSTFLPSDLLDMFAPRVQETHVRSSRDQVWDEALGDGDVRLQDLAELLDDYDFKGWHVIELSREPKTPKTITLPESLKRSYLYLQTMLAASNRATRWRYRHS